MERPLLHRPYPPPDSQIKEVHRGLILGLFIAGFLYFFQPFGINEANYASDVRNFLGFGLITTASYVLYLGLLPLAVPNFFRERSWTVGRQLGLYVVLLLTIAVGNGLFINYLGGLSFSIDNTARIVWQTAMLGAIPLSLLVLIQYNHLLKRALTAAREIQPELPSTNLPTAAPNAVLAVEAHGNYVAIYRSGMPRSLDRATLSGTLRNLNEPDVVRCHRSWLVNLERVTAVTGNAQGVQLAVEGMEAKVPVSRTYIRMVRERLSEMACKSSQKDVVRH